MITLFNHNTLNNMLAIEHASTEMDYQTILRQVFREITATHHVNLQSFRNRRGIFTRSIPVAVR